MFKIDTPKIQQAVLLAKAFHFGQKYGSHDYFDHHIVGVASIAQNLPEAVDIGLEEVIITAILHDILEDTVATEDTLDELFSFEVVEAVKCLSKNITHNDRFGYAGRISQNKLALCVKKADAMFNMSSNIATGDLVRANKYWNLIKELLG